MAPEDGMGQADRWGEVFPTESGWVYPSAFPEHSCSLRAQRGGELVGKSWQ